MKSVPRISSCQYPHRDEIQAQAYVFRTCCNAEFSPQRNDRADNSNRDGNRQQTDQRPDTSVTLFTTDWNAHCAIQHDPQNCKKDWFFLIKFFHVLLPAFFKTDCILSVLFCHFKTPNGKMHFCAIRCITEGLLWIKTAQMHTLTQDLKYRVKPSKSVRALYDGANSGDWRPCPSSCAASVRSPVSPQTSIC